MPFLSIVIPTYNERRRIVDTLTEVAGYLATQAYSWEVVVADDGSTDGTADLVREFREGHPGVRLLPLSHGGKGWAVRHGILEAQGEFRFTCDADLSMPIAQISRFLPPDRSGFDVAIASREVPGARRIGEPGSRRLMGRIYNLAVRALVLPGLADTQCGFKCYRGQVAEEVFPLQRFDGFSFDVEVLYIARRRGMVVVEVPIDWYYRSHSKVRPVRDSLAMARDLLRMRWRRLSGRYGRSRPPR